MTYTNERYFPSTAKYSCPDGYVLSEPQSATRNCVASSSGVYWEGDSSNYPVACYAVPCAGLVVPDNGYVDQLTSTSFEFKCNDGYQVDTTNPVVTCVTKGSAAMWNTPVFPRCQPRQCPQTLSVDNGNVSYSNGGVYPSTAFYSCNDGFALESPEDYTRQCEFAGSTVSWSGSAPKCIEIGCPPLSVPEHGTLNYDTSGPAVRALFTCDDGYDLYPAGTSNVRTCQRKGSASAWLPADVPYPTCRAVSCGTVAPLANGVVTYTNKGNYPSSAVYSCKTGYVLAPSDYAVQTCVVGAGSGTTTKWCFLGQDYANCDTTISPPTCQPVACPGLALPFHGTVFVTPLSGANPVAKADISCADGFDFDPAYTGGNPYTMVCYKNGASSYWTPTVTPNNAIPTCKAIKCSIIPPPQSGTVTYTNYDDTGAPIFPSTAVYTCDDNYVMTGISNSNSVIQCYSDGQWSSLVTPECTPVACPALVVPLNGFVLSVSADGKTVEWGCNPEYDLSWPNGGSGTSSTCTITGVRAEWNYFPKCLPKKCGDVVVGANVTVQYTNKQLYPSSALFSCPADYVLQPLEATSASCTFVGSNTVWVGTIPTCEAVPCAALAEVVNANPIVYGAGSGSVLATATITCLDGYELSGTSVLNCYAKGAVPTWSADLPKCNPRKCLDAPPSPSNGVVTLTNKGLYPSNAVFTCNDGAILSDASLAVVDCVLDGLGVPRFSTNVPTCEGLASPTFGSVDTSGQDGNEAKFSCYTGFEITPSSASTTFSCQKKGTTSRWVNSNGLPENFPTCRGVICPRVADVSSPLFVSYSNDRNEIGPRFPSVAAFSCLGDGYVLVGKASANCFIDPADGAAKWDSETPKCTAVPIPGLALPEYAKDLVIDTSDPTNNTVLVTCQPGYFVYNNYDDPFDPSVDTSTSFTVTVQYLGSVAYWPRVMPRCQAGYCPLIQPNDPLLKISYTNQGAYEPTPMYPSTAIFDCPDGYQLIPNTQAVNCLWTGTGFEWDPSVRMPECIAQICPPLPSPQFGTLSFSWPSVQFVCDSGYELVGTSDTFTCDGLSLSGGGGYWFDVNGNAAAPGSFPSCKPVYCGAPPTIDNAIATSNGGDYYPTSATYACNPGWVLNQTDANTLYCNATGTYVASSGTAPSCIPAPIRPYPAPTNGYVTHVYDPNNASPPQAQITCFDGYKLNGAQVIYSQPINNGYEWIKPSVAPTCIGLQCYTGLSVANGRIAFTNGARYPSSVFYMCDTGFLLSDTSKAVGLCVVDSAGQNADWRFTSQTYDPQNSTTVDPPTCVASPPPECPALQTPNNGKLFFNTQNGETRAFFICETPFGLTLDGVTMTYSSGAGFLCRGGVWKDESSGQIVKASPACIAPSCGTPPSLQNANIYVTNNGKYPSTAFYSCNFKGKFLGTKDCQIASSTAAYWSPVDSAWSCPSS